MERIAKIPPEPSARRRARNASPDVSRRARVFSSSSSDAGNLSDDPSPQIRLTPTRQVSGSFGSERVTRIRRAASFDPVATPIATPNRIQRSTIDSVGNRVANGLIQRQLVRGATQLAPDINLAGSIPRGYPSGFTPPVVNDQVMPVPIGTAAAATAALQAPEVAVEPDPSGHGHRARVTRAPTNRVGAQVHYPTPPIWTDPAAQALRISGVAIGGEAPDKRFEGSATLDVLNGVNTTRFRARGEIGDAGFRQQILTHEQHHADDHWTVAQTVLGGWDAALTSAQTDGETFPGDSPAAAETALLAAAGGTTQQLGARLDSEWSRLDQAFHATLAGKPSDVSHYFVEADGSKVDAWYKYPY